MVHLLSSAARCLSRTFGYNVFFENILFRRSFATQRYSASTQSRYIISSLHPQLSQKTKERPGKRERLLDTNSRIRRWYTPTSDHAKTFNFIADAVEIASPAVVYVDVKIPQQGGLFGMGGVAQGAGSGFVVTDYGVILTNAHVVNNASSVAVKLASSDVSNISFGVCGSLAFGNWVFCLIILASYQL